uniref:Uncharacterized protein n=1 Tax=Panagrolaimus sp. ES5 TaxID=591445 RepID=A0AC34FG58_9BILA
MVTERNMTQQNVQLTDQQARLDALKRVLQGNAGNQDVLEEGELESDDDEACKKRGSITPNENVVKKFTKSNEAAYKNVQPCTSAAVAAPVVGETAMDCDVSKKQESTKRKAESYSKKYDDVKKPKTDESDSSSPSSKSTPTPPYQFVSSLWGDYKIPKKGSSDAATSSEVKRRQQSSSQPSSLATAFSNSSLLEKCYEDYISSSGPKSKPYYSPQHASASTIKSQTTKTIKSSTSRGYSESPHPLNGGKTIKMTPLSHPQQQQHYTSCKPQKPVNGFPRCELLTDNGIKMIIRFPKKV